jgi:hypothetical protein
LLVVGTGTAFNTTSSGGGWNSSRQRRSDTCAGAVEVMKSTRTSTNRAGASPAFVKRLVPEAALAVERHALPNLRSLNFIVHGLLGDGVAASTRSDAQAKSLGEFLRARLVDIPRSLLAECDVAHSTARARVVISDHRALVCRLCANSAERVQGAVIR